MARPDDEDEIAKSKRPQLFPRNIEGLGVAEMRAYIAELDVEKAKVQREIDTRGGIKNAAESLFKPKAS